MGATTEYASIVVTPDRIRHVVKETTGRVIDTPAAEGFLLVFGDDVQTALTEALRSEVAKHFPAKVVRDGTTDSR